jgi:hypothetical protein
MWGACGGGGESGLGEESQSHMLPYSRYSGRTREKKGGRRKGKMIGEKRRVKRSVIRKQKGREGKNVSNR